MKNTLFLLLFLCFSSFSFAQTISGSVFFDGNSNGVKDATEVGYHGVTVKAFNSANTEVASATTSPLSGDYTLSGLTTGQRYRVEFTVPSPANSGVFGTSSSSSVQFAMAGATGINFSVHVPSETFTDTNPRLIAGCGIGGVGQNGQPTDPSVASWMYNSNYPIDVPTQSQGDPNSQFTLYASVIHPHDEDMRANQVGIPFGLSVHPKTKLVFFSTLSSPFSTVFPAAPDGAGAIYVADYSGPNSAFVGYKLFTTVSNVSGTAFFGKYGLGGIDFSQDGANLFVINMANGKLVKIPVSGNSFASISAGSATEIAIPSNLTSCTSGTYRPIAMKEYGGKLYISGVCDAGDLRISVISFDYTTTTWKEELSFLASSFNAGNMIGLNSPQVAWQDPEGNNPDGTPMFAPAPTDITFDDTGGMILGVTNRKVLSNNSNYETGYVLRAWRNNDGTFTLENAGIVGPLTGNPYFLAWLQTNYAVSSIGGPGGKWFFDQSMKFHPYVYNGGLFVCPGTNEVVWGASDPLSINSMGARYLNLTDGNITKGINLAGSKISRLTGMDAITSGGAIEIGNLVWNDANTNGRQDADENGIAGVSVQLKNAAGTVLATATTDANGNYIFSSNPNLANTPDGSRVYSLALTDNTSYKVCIPNSTTQTPLSGKSLSTANIGSNSEDQRDSDGTLVGANAEVSLVTGVLGENNHNFDFGFGTVQCTTPTAGTPSVTQATCNAAGTAANNDASISISGITNGTVFAYTTNGTDPAFAGATAITGGSISLTNLANPASATTYKFRIFNATADCYLDVTAVLNPRTCSPTCTTPNAGTDVTICLPKTTTDLVDASAGLQWVVGSGNPATATINATTGVISGLTVAGTYTFTLQTISNTTCKDDIQVIVTNGDAPIALCNDGSTSYTLTAPANLTNVIWYNMAGTQVGTGNSLIVNSTTLGLSDGSEAYYYHGVDGSASGCDVELCCPVKFVTQSCCPVPNCGTITVIKN